MRRETFALDQLTWPEVGRVLARESRLIVPVGALEQHGPHLPLGTNTFIAENVARRLSGELGILRAPTVPYGVTLQGPGKFSGTAGLRRKTLHRAVNELLAAWEDHGVSEFVVISAHRHEPHLDALLMALTQESATTVIDLYGIEVHDLLEGAPEGEHGGELETSLLLFLDPGRVRKDQIADLVLARRERRRYVRGRVPTPPAGSQGTVGRPSLATPEKGQAIFERWTQVLKEILARRDGA